MIIVRFKVQCQPDRVEQVKAAFERVITPARGVAGVVHFDIAQDLSDSRSFIATEVFEDREALDRQEALPQVAEVLAVLADSLAAEPEATIFHVSSSEPHGA